MDGDARRDFAIRVSAKTMTLAINLADSFGVDAETLVAIIIEDLHANELRGGRLSSKQPPATDGSGNGHARGGDQL